MAEAVDPHAQADLPIDPTPLGLLDRGMSYHRQGRLADAERIYKAILRQQPKHFDALHLLGVVAIQCQQARQGAELIEKAIQLNPDVAGAHSNLGKARRDLKDYAGALKSFDRAILLDPGFAEAHNNRASVLLDLNRPREALASCNIAIDLKPHFAEAYDTRGLALENLGRPEEALASYDKAISLKADFAAAYNNRGNTLLSLRRASDALASYDKALALLPTFAMAYCNRGTAFIKLNRPAEALASFDRAIVLEPGLALAHLNRGRALTELNRLDEAVVAYDKAFALQSDLAEAEGNRLLAKMKICRWDNFDSDSTSLVSSVLNRNQIVTPLAFLAVPSSNEAQLKCAKLWIAREYPASDRHVWQRQRYRHDRIRVAYLSPDLHKHAIALLAAGLFKCHDRNRFHITALSSGPDDNSEIRQRLRESFDQFVDVAACSDDEIARLVGKLEIDILVDLAGFTFGSRTAVCARRPAPISVSYLGYPGTSGADYIDYIIADRIVIPEQHREFYTEKVAYLPNSYQVNDATRLVPGKSLTREECGLPSTGFVYCCFNTSHKLTPFIFHTWMRILAKVPDSILWLLETNTTAADNLKKEAARLGVSPERINFAKRLSLPDHLARHCLADLFLDTLPYNAHTTASDALWARLPVLTCLGNTFSGRVSASLLHAIDLAELVTDSLDDYERMAVELAMHPERLAGVRNRLAANLGTTPLFNTKLFTEHLESAYSAMYERHQSHLPPEDIFVQS